MSRPITMADIAARAGVTVATVSRALTERTAVNLRAETVARIRAVADELGYRPNALARGLRTRRSATLGMLTPDLTNPFMPPIVRAVEEVLTDAGYTLIVANTDNHPERETRLLRTMVDRQVEGLLLATARLDPGWHVDRTTTPVPVVLVNRSSRLDLPTVVPDDAQCVGLVVAHLLGLGHTRIGHVAGPPGISTGRDRAEAFAHFVGAAGHHDPGRIEYTERLAVEDGRRACSRLLDRHPDLTAIAAANDLLAIGCLRTLRERGQRVPDDVSLVGFNDMQFVDLLDPPLTTVRVPQVEMGRAAAALLLDLVSDAPEAASSSAHVRVPGQLVVRGSSGPSRA